MSWEHVFNTNKTIHVNQEIAFQVATNCGYRFAIWNGIVYFLVCSSNYGNQYYDTGLTIDDLF